MSGRASRLFLSVVLLLALAVPALIVLPTARAAPPAVAFDSAVDGSTTCTTTCAFGPITVSTDASTLVLVEIDLTQLQVTPQPTLGVTGVTIGSTPATLLVNYSGSSQFRQYVWYAVGIASGAPSVGMTTSLAPNHQVGYSLQSFYNVKQSAPFAQASATNWGSTTGTSVTLTATLGSTPGANDMMTDFAALEDLSLIGSPTAGGSQTVRFAQSVNAFADYVMGSTLPGGSTPTMTWLSSGIPQPSTEYWQEIVMDIAAVAPIVPTFTFTTTGLTATFTSSAVGGTAPYTYSWDFGDAGTSTSQNPSHTYASGATYTVVLTVTDAGANTGDSTQGVRVSVGGSSSSPPPPSLPPTVVTYPDLINLRCNVVTFNDPRGDAAVASTVLWVYNFGDGSALDYSPVPAVTHTYVAEGVYDATMTTQDRQGNVQTYSMSVDTTLTGCAGAVIRGVVPPTFLGLFVALLVASIVAGRRHQKWRRRFRTGAVVSLVVVIGVVVLL